MTLSIAARADWIVRQALDEKIPIDDALRQLQDFADILRASDQEKSARTVEDAKRMLTESRD